MSRFGLLAISRICPAHLPSRQSVHALRSGIGVHRGRPVRMWDRAPHNPAGDGVTLSQLPRGNPCVLGKLGSAHIPGMGYGPEVSWVGAQRGLHV